MLSIPSLVAENVAVSDAAKPPPTFPHLGALFLWLVIQLLALALPTLQIPLSDNFPRPIERLAVHELVIVQVLAAAMLFPMLFKNIATTIALVASTWPFLQLAGMLAATPTPRLLCAALYLALWMTALALINATLRSRRAQLQATALTTSFTLAGPLLWYLYHEFDTDVTANHDLLLTGTNPILSATEILNSQRRSGSSMWVLMLILLASSLIAALLTRRRVAKLDNLSTAHPQGFPPRSGPPPVF